MLSDKEIKQASTNQKDSFAIGPIELDDTPEVEDNVESKSNDSQKLADWETSRTTVDLEQVPAVPSSPSAHSTDGSLFDQLNEV